MSKMSEGSFRANSVFFLSLLVTAPLALRRDLVSRASALDTQWMIWLASWVARADPSDQLILFAYVRHRC